MFPVIVAAISRHVYQRCVCGIADARRSSRLQMSRQVAMQLGGQVHEPRGWLSHRYHFQASGFLNG